MTSYEILWILLITAFIISGATFIAMIGMVLRELWLDDKVAYHDKERGSNE